MNSIVVRLLCVCLLAAGVATAFAQADQKPKNFDPSQEATVVEAMKVSTRFENDGSNVQTIQQRIKVQNAAGVKQSGIVSFDYVTTQAVNIDYIEVHKPNGAVIKVGPENVRDAAPATDMEAPTYSDLRRKEVTVPGLNIGDELVFQSTYKSTSMIPGHFWFEYSFAKHRFVLSEIVEVSVPKTRKLRVKSASEYKPEIKDSGDRTIYVWTGSHQKPAEEDKAGSFYDSLDAARKEPPPDILLSTFSSWEEIGSWYGSLQKDRIMPTPAVKAKALEVTQGLTTPEAKMKALYGYVASNFRYISIDFGIGRYQSHSADEVLANGYGDCKDKHTLLASMLQAVGIDSVPALMNSSRLVDPDVPSPAQFDHVITAVSQGNSFLFMDTTEETAPFGLLFFGLRGKKALVVLPEHPRFEETPVNPSGPVQEIFELNGKIDASGTLEAEITRRFRGDSEITIGMAFRNTPPGKYKDLVQNLSYITGFAGDVSDVKVLNQAGGGFGVSYHYHRLSYYDFSDKRPAKSVPLVVFLPEMETGQEKLRLYFSPGELLYKCRVELPQGVNASVPLAVKLERSYARFESTYSVQKNVVTAEKKISILQPEITGALRQDYASFSKAIASDEAQEVVLKLGPDFEPKTAALNSGDLDNLMQQGEFSLGRNDYQAAYQAFRKVAAQDPKYKSIWAHMGTAEIMMDRREDGLKDLQKQVEVDPFDAGAYVQLGWAYFRFRKSDDGIKAMKKAIEIDPLNHNAHDLLGMHYYTEKDCSSAAPELEKSLATVQSGNNNEAATRGMLATCWFQLKQPEKAAELLARQVEASPEPRTWTEVAHALADNDFQLDKAREYTQLAIKALTERLTSVEEDAFSVTDMNSMGLLISAWDTLGWIYFKSGDTAQAEKYVHSAWMMSQSRDIGEHLGEIYQKLGRTQDAVRYYAMSAIELFSFSSSSAPAPDPARARLVKLVGQPRAKVLIDKYRSDPSQMRTFHLGRIAPAGTKAELLFVFGAGPKIETLKVLGGDNSLLEPLRKAALPIEKMAMFPENTPAKFVRQGFLSCSQYTPGCDLVLNIVDLGTTITLAGRR